MDVGQYGFVMLTRPTIGGFRVQLTPVYRMAYPYSGWEEIGVYPRHSTAPFSYMSSTDDGRIVRAR